MKQPLFNIKCRMGEDHDWYVVKTDINYEDAIKEVNKYADTFREVSMEALSTNDADTNYIVRRNYNTKRFDKSLTTPVTSKMYVTQPRVSYKEIDHSRNPMSILVLEPIDKAEVSAEGSHVYVVQVVETDDCGDLSDWVFGVFNNYDKGCLAVLEAIEGYNKEEEERHSNPDDRVKYHYTVSKEDLL